MTYLLGLTGSIGMGKTTTAKMFKKAGVPVWDADNTVHKLYARGGAAVDAVERVFPAAVSGGAISREILGDLIAKDPTVLDTIEDIVHPMVKADREEFIAQHSEPLLVFDIPLLFETQADSWLDSVLVVTTDPDIQKRRVLDRPAMTEEKLKAILKRQMADSEKRAMADHIIQTSSIEETRESVANLIDEILGNKDA